MIGAESQGKFQSEQRTEKGELQQRLKKTIFKVNKVGDKGFFDNL